MHIVNRGECANDAEHTENNKHCQECKLFLEQVLVNFCMVFPLILLDNFCLVSSPLIWCASHLQGKQLPSTLTKLTLNMVCFPSSGEAAV